MSPHNDTATPHELIEKWTPGIFCNGSEMEKVIAVEATAILIENGAIPESRETRAFVKWFRRVWREQPMLTVDELHQMRAEARASTAAEHTVWWLLLCRAVERETTKRAAQACRDVASEMRRAGVGATNAMYDWQADGAEECALELERP